MKKQSRPRNNHEGASTSSSLSDKILRKLKNRPLVASIIVICTVISGLAAFTESLTNIAQFVTRFVTGSNTAKRVFVGTIYYDDGLPLMNAQVTIVDGNNKPLSRTYETGNDGKFIVKAAISQSAFFLVEKDGCKSRYFPLPGDSYVHSKLSLHCEN